MYRVDTDLFWFKNCLRFDSLSRKKKSLRHVYGYCLYSCLVSCYETSIPADNIQIAKNEYIQNYECIHI